jgi:hypothetical protein
MGETRGWIEAAARLTRVLLGSPRVKGALRSALRNLDPEQADALVDALCATDPEVPLELCAAIPALANSGIGIVRALVRKLQRLPAPLVVEAVVDVFGRIDRRALGDALDGALAVLDQLLAEPELAASFAELAGELGRTFGRHPRARAGLSAIARAFSTEASR